jgi:L-rhamnose mutarotase
MSVRWFVQIPGLVLTECLLNVISEIILFTAGMDTCSVILSIPELIADMHKMAADSLTNEWWKLTDPCQEPVESAGDGIWWDEMEEVYHLD